MASTALTRPPHVAILDRARRRAALTTVPPGCRPERILTAAGAGVLLCAPSPRPPKVDVYMASSDGRWTKEGALSIEARAATALSAAPDGTLLLRAGWSGEAARRAFVRSPAPLGDPAAWRELDVAGVVEARVDIGGGALLFTTRAVVPAPTSVTLWLDRPGSIRVRIADRVPVEGSLLDAAIEGRTVVVWSMPRIIHGDCRARRDEGDRDGHARSVLTRAGGLITR